MYMIVHVFFAHFQAWSLLKFRTHSWTASANRSSIKTSSLNRISNIGSIYVSYLPLCSLSVLLSPNDAFASESIYTSPCIKDDNSCVQDWFSVGIISFLDNIYFCNFYHLKTQWSINTKHSAYHLVFWFSLH